MSNQRPDLLAPLTVELGTRRYDILIGAGLLAEAGGAIRDRLGARALCLVADEAAAAHHLAPLQASLAEAGLPVKATVLVPPGEASKSFAGYGAVCEQVLAARPDRSTVLLALGGGMAGDLAGFAAATLLRGVDFVQAPTTLLSQVDSSVGGKTGINARAGKNLVGAFHQPRLVIADTATLRTLPRRELLGGYAEIAKHALIVDRPFFEELERIAPAALGIDAIADEAARVAMIHRSCEIKAGIVARDEHERGDRALLNFGHTFGHGLELLTGYGAGPTHGEAVAIGCALATRLSVELRLCPPADLARTVAHLSAVGLPTTIDPAWRIDANTLVAAMRGDKKNADGRIRLVLTRGIGKAFRSNGVDEELLASFLSRRQPEVT